MHELIMLTYNYNFFFLLKLVLLLFFFTLLYYTVVDWRYFEDSVFSGTLHSSPPIMVFLLVPPHAACALFVPLHWGVCSCVPVCAPVSVCACECECAPREHFEDGLDLCVHSPTPSSLCDGSERVCVCLSAAVFDVECKPAWHVYVCVCFSMCCADEMKKGGVCKWICAGLCVWVGVRSGERV